MKSIGYIERRLAWTAVLSTVLGACSSAGFKGSGSVQATPPVVTLRCSTTHALVGERAKILVAGENTKDPIRQIVRKKGGGKVQDAKLVLTDDGYLVETIKDGKTSYQLNAFEATQEGDFEVVLSQVFEGEDAPAGLAPACGFEVRSQVIPPNPKCTDGKRIIGGQVGLMLDLSASTAKTDCPDAVPRTDRRGQVLSDRGSPLSTCRSMTGRETASLGSFDNLVALSRPELPESVSYVQVAGFSDVQAPTTAGWVPATAAERTSIANFLTFTRFPVGNTPFVRALESMVKMFETEAPALPATLPARPRVGIVVSDGFPTDVNIDGVLALAEKLRKQMKVKLFAVFLSPQSTSEMIERHKEIMKPTYERHLKERADEAWKKKYPTFEDFFKALVGKDVTDGVLGAISDQAPIPVSKAADLKATFLKIIREEAVACR